MASNVRLYPGAAAAYWVTLMDSAPSNSFTEEPERNGRDSRAGLHPLADLVSAERALDRRVPSGAERPQCRSGGEGPGQLALRAAGRARQRQRAWRGAALR